jgi:NAD(P)-dependent dehydrogenase (short-subunit alcohol dehydrogenase family)
MSKTVSLATHATLPAQTWKGSLKALFEFATEDGKLDHVIDTAGNRFGLVKIGDATTEDIQKHSKVRFMGALLMAKLAPQYMHQTNQSSITSTGGVNSTKPGPGWSVTAGWDPERGVWQEALLWISSRSE